MTPNPDNYNQDELEAPAWLNDAKFFATALCKSENDDSIEVKKFTITPASMKGDHYASVMFRVAVDYTHAGENKHKALIIKTMPELEGHKKEFLQESKVFETEIGMYVEVLPEIERILRSIGDETLFGPPCLYYSLEPKKMLVFEDMVPQGYTVIRDRPLNLDEIKIAYIKLAKMHAVSYKLSQENPKRYDKYHDNFVTMPDAMKQDFMVTGTDFFIDKISTIPNLQKFVPYFETLKDKLLYGFRDTFVEHQENRQENGIYVLCHGDFHLKNMMFKHNTITKQIQDIKLLDFQLSYMGPIINDVIYSYFMLINAEQRANFDEWLYFYLQNFTETLKKIGFKGKTPKLIEFRQLRQQHKFFELFMLTSFLPIWLSFNVNIEVDQLMTNGAYRRKTYDNVEFVKELESLLPKYLHLGYFEN